VLKLADALRIVNARRQSGPADWQCFLATGFTPLHFQTYLHSILLQKTQAIIELKTGVFGDLVGNVQRIVDERPGRAVILIEWSDLDSRLGYRSTHGWRAANLEDILTTVSQRLDQLRHILLALGKSTIACLSLPTLPLPPFFLGSQGQNKSFTFSLYETVYGFAAELSLDNVLRILNSETLTLRSPLNTRHDIRSDLSTGFPYQLAHAAILAEELAELMVESPRKKGIITDLDNTLWRGILGEDGVSGITWDLDHSSHEHALYQETLASLSDSGVLIGVATKNEPDLVTQALCRDDLVVPASALFPVESGWGPKSESVRKILDDWNIGPEDVVFIDDSALELAEVSAAYPDIECLRFPVKDERGVLGLAGLLRSRFQKSAITEEDIIRVASLKSCWKRSRDISLTPDEFLSQAEAELTVEFDQPDTRSFELINKTNQFNLNGHRLDESQWRSRNQDPESFLVTASYKDRFGPLGKIAVVCGRRSTSIPTIDIWVMSCRAFSRRIEYQVLRVLFDFLGVDRLQLSYAHTERNSPMQNLLRHVTGQDPADPTFVHDEECRARSPQFFGKLIIR
jgi:FkbH-like protein